MKYKSTPERPSNHPRKRCVKFTAIKETLVQGACTWYQYFYRPCNVIWYVGIGRNGSSFTSHGKGMPWWGCVVCTLDRDTQRQRTCFYQNTLQDITLIWSFAHQGSRRIHRKTWSYRLCKMAWYKVTKKECIVAQQQEGNAKVGLYSCCQC